MGGQRENVLLLTEWSIIKKAQSDNVGAGYCMLCQEVKLAIDTTPRLWQILKYWQVANAKENNF